MSIKVFTNFIYDTEILDVAKLFFEDVQRTDNKADADIVNIVTTQNNLFVATTTYSNTQYKLDAMLDTSDNLQSIRVQKRIAKIATYRCLSKVTGISQPWGSLTGIRPTKLAYQLMNNEGADYVKQFTESFDVSAEKIKLVQEIIEQQKGLRILDDNCVDLYIGIPFCVSKCSYCSFTSGTIDKLQKFVEPYIEALKFELKQTIKFAKENNYKIVNVYMGGGTPTSLDYKQLQSILSLIDFVPTEFCVEAGRPDTITEDKLKVFDDCGVSRISINPQTFNQSVLDIVGRSHSVKDIVDKYYMARKYNFDINMDLIAGLPAESYSMFCHSVDSAVALRPDNITVHTLALKKGSLLKEQSYHTEQSKLVCDMVEYSSNTLRQNGYAPYYLYRQKYMTNNLENVGYCLPNKQCRYNIDIMEETRSILACGCNAISKRLFNSQDRIERCANQKDIITYIDKVNQQLEKKQKLFER